MRHRSSLAFVVCSLCVVSSSVARAQAGDDDLLGGFDKPAEQPAAAPAPASEPAAVEPAPAAAAPESAAAPDETQAAPAAVAPAPAAAASRAVNPNDPAALDRIKAVPKKAVLKAHRVELSPMFSLSLNDAFYQHFAVSGAAVWYPHDSFGLGVGVDYLYAHVKTSNVDYVREGLTSVPASFEQPRLFGHLDFYWVPIYGKSSLFDSFIMHFELYALAGIGAATAFDGEAQPLVDAGIGHRSIIGDWLALRLEVRNHSFLDDQAVNTIRRSDIQSYTMFMAGLSFFIPPSFEYSFR